MSYHYAFYVDEITHGLSIQDEQLSSKALCLLSFKSHSASGKRRKLEEATLLTLLQR